MIPAMPKIPAAIPPTMAPVETLAPVFVAFPLSLVEEGLEEREEAREDRVNEVAGSDVFRVEETEVLAYSDSVRVNDETNKQNKPWRWLKRVLQT